MFRKEEPESERNYKYCVWLNVPCAWKRASTTDIAKSDMQGDDQIFSPGPSKSEMLIR